MSEIPAFVYEKPLESADGEYALFETAETVFDRTPPVVKTESAVTTLVDFPPVIIEQTQTAVGAKRIEDIGDLKIRESSPLEIEQELTIDPESLQIEQELAQLGRRKILESIGEAVHTQQDSEDQQVHTVSRENPVGEVLTNSIKRVKTKLRDIQLFTDSQETIKSSSSVVIRVVKDKGKIVLGILNTQVEDDEEKTDLAEINPIITVTELAKALDYIKKITLNIRLNEESGMDNNLDEEQTISQIDVVVSNEILELIEAIAGDYKPSLEAQVKNDGVINRQTVTFSAYGESKKQLIIDARQLSQIQQFLIALDLSFEQNTQDEEKRVLHKLDLLGEIESLVQKIESQLKDKTSELTMIVSQDLMAFLEKGGKIIQETEKTNPGIFRSNKSKKETKVKQFIAISSSDRKIKIDLVTLKMLMKLLKKKRLIESEQAPEEIKGYVKTFQNGNNVSIWFIYQVIIFLLALVDTQRSDYNPKHSKVLQAFTKQ